MFYFYQYNFEIFGTVGYAASSTSLTKFWIQGLSLSFLQIISRLATACMPSRVMYEIYHLSKVQM